jgi:glycosyltransferase involved in cell wall biosynthesis
MQNILLISPDNIGKKMAGPGIRYWNFALKLSRYFTVTLMTPNMCDFDNGKVNFKIVKLSNKNLKLELNNADVIILQGLTLFNYPLLKKADIPIIIDIYDPFILENLELRKELPLKQRIAYHQSDLNIILEQLAYGDYFICASEKQKDYWLGMLSAINRINPITYDEDNTMNKLIGIVPFGLPKERPIKSKRVLKGVYPGINKDDKVIIWGGGIWNWFDPLTPIKAIWEISKERKDIKLFFMSTKHPNPKMAKMEMVDRAIKLSNELGITNKYVFFNYDWIPYEERQNYFLESDIGISSHLLHLETRFSFRTRILDYLWCELPMIVTEGDSMAELVKEKKLGRVIREKNVEDLKEAILKTVENPVEYKQFKYNINQVKKKFYWEDIVNPLINFCKIPNVKVDKKKIKLFYKKNYTLNVIQYYAIRIKKAFTKKGIKKIITIIKNKLMEEEQK